MASPRCPMFFGCAWFWRIVGQLNWLMLLNREAKAESKEAEAIKHPERSWNEISN